MSDEKSEAMATIQCTAGAAPERKRDGSARKGGKDADVADPYLQLTYLL